MGQDQSSVKTEVSFNAYVKKLITHQVNELIVLLKDIGKKQQKQSQICKNKQ